MKGMIELQLWQAAAAYLFVLVVLLIVRWKRIPREKAIVVSAVRMTLQLIIMGYVLVYIFENPSPWFSLAVLAAMVSFAVYNITKRAKEHLTPKLKTAVAVSMTLGTLACLFYFLLVVVGLSPWYDPQYLIPLAGMLVGNSMTAVALGINNLLDAVRSRRALITDALMLGATPKRAMKPILNSAFDAALLPTVNSMLGIGIVFLPGLMTGQILSGISPFTAIEYQIAIMLGIMGSVTLSVTIFLQLAYKSFFNEDAQLVVPTTPKAK